MLPFKFFSVFPRRERFRMQEVTFFSFFIIFFTVLLCAKSYAQDYSGITQALLYLIQRILYPEYSGITQYSLLVLITQALLRHYSGLLMCYSGIVVFDSENTHKVVTPTSPLLESRKVVFRKVN